MANNTNGKTTATPKAPNHRGYYNQVWAAWQVKQLGPQPTNEQLGIIHGLGARAGKQALANAMALREQGVTGSQIKAASALYDGNPTPQLNKMRAFVTEAKVLEWVPMPPAGGGKVYRTKVTARGRDVLKSMGDRVVHVTPALKALGEGKPAKAPVAAKAKPKRVAKAKGAAKPGEGAKHPFSVGGPSSGPTAAPSVPSTPPSARTVLTEQGPKVLGQQSEQPKT